MRGPIGNMMQQAQRMQEQMQRAQDEIAKLEVIGQAGAGMVTVTVTGAHETRRVKIDPSLLGDAEMLEDLIVAACNDANNKIAAETKTRMAAVTGGLNLPAGLKLPF